eukprot:4253017-Prymnesium_polylepis.1
MQALENVTFNGKALIVERSADNAYGYKFVCKKDEDSEGPRFYAKRKLEGEPKQRSVPGTVEPRLLPRRE